MSVVEEAVASGQDLSEAVDAAVEKAEEEARQKKREKSNTELVKRRIVGCFRVCFLHLRLLFVLVCV